MADGETPAPAPDPTPALPETVRQPDFQPRADLGNILRTELSPAEALTLAEIGDVLPQLLDNYGRAYLAAFEVERNLTALAEHLNQPALPSDAGRRALRASKDPNVIAIRNQILLEFDRPNQDQATKDRLFRAIVSAIALGGVIDISLHEQLKAQKQVISRYRDPNTQDLSKIRNGIALIDGRTDRTREGTPQEEVLAAYWIGVRDHDADPTLGTMLRDGTIRDLDGFINQTFDRYLVFLRDSRLDPALFCPDANFYTRLCRGVGLQDQIGVFDVTSPATGIDRRSPEARARRLLQEMTNESNTRNSRPQGPLADINVYTENITAFGVHVGQPINWINDAMNYVAGFVPDPEHMFNADVGSLMQVGLKLYLGTVGLLNLAAMGVGTFNRVRKGFSALASGDLSTAANEIKGVFVDAYEAIPGPVGTGMLALAFGASRFTNPQEAMDWAGRMLSGAGTTIQQYTGIDLQERTQALGTLLSENIGPYWRKGKQGVIEFFEEKWDTISNFTHQKREAARTWIENYGFDMEELSTHFACKRDLAREMNAHLSGVTTSSGTVSVRIDNGQFNSLLPVYLAKLGGVNLDASPPPSIPSIRYEELQQAGILDQASVLLEPREPPYAEFAPSSALAQSLKAQAEWLGKNSTIFN